MRLIGFGLLLAQVAFAGAFTDQRRGFSFELPAGYQRFDEDNKGRHAFVREVSPGVEATLLMILSDKQLGQDLVVERAVIEKSLRKGAESSGVRDAVIEHRKVRWGAFELDVDIIKSVEKANVGLSSRVPLESGLIYVMVTGPISDEQQVNADFDGVMSSLKGQTNWKTKQAQVGFYLGLAVVPLAVVLVVLWRLFRRRK